MFAPDRWRDLWIPQKDVESKTVFWIKTAGARLVKQTLAA